MVCVSVSSSDDQSANLGLRLFTSHARETLEIQPIEQLLVDAALDLLIVRMTHVRRRGRPATEAAEDGAVRSVER